jgi:hypothetical protein
VQCPEFIPQFQKERKSEREESKGGEERGGRKKNL